MKEIWKEYQRIYKGKKEIVREISNQGKIRENGIIVNIGTDNLGYARYKGHLVHRLVALYFIDNPDNKKEVDHINCIRDDNRVENLRWVNRLENCNNPITKKNLKDAMNRPEVKKLQSDNSKRYWNNEELVNKRHTLRGKEHPMYGKKYSEEHNKKVSKSRKDKIYINNGIRNKMIYEQELEYYLNNGYVIGEIMKERGPISGEHKLKISKSLKNRIVVNNGDNSFHIWPNELDEYLNKGYVRGRIKVEHPKRKKKR